MPVRLLIAAIVSWLAGVTPLYASDHIRVVLDISGSMATNDKPRLATLAAMLLHDLADPNPPLGDSFQIIPFHRTVSWASGGPAPTEIGTRIVRQASRDAFLSAVKRLQYDGKTTYFYPGLRAAIADLESAAMEQYDRRVVVLITDGVPLGSTRAEEAQRIKDELLPRYLKAGVRLCILAFGGEAANNRDFFSGLVTADDLFLDPTGAELLENMARIFSRTFGYTFSPPTSFVGSMATLDLEGHQAANRVAVIAYRRDKSVPAIKVNPSPHVPDGTQQAEEAGSSYSLRWVLDPVPGSYRFQSDPLGGMLAVLRPTQLAIEVRPGAARRPTDSAIGNTPMSLDLVVSPDNGPRGDPGADVNVSYRVCGPREGQGYSWCETAVGAGTGTPAPDGRVYSVEPLFSREPDATSEFYRGHIEVTVMRRDALVGSLRQDRAHQVTVYPFIRLTPQPAGADLVIDGAVKALTRGERGCARFTFERSGALPHPSRPQYNLRAVLDASLAGDRRLVGATFTLNGRSLDVAAGGSPIPAAWLAGQALTDRELLGDHEFCVQLGKPREGANPMTVPVQFTLLEQPYEAYPTVGPFAATVRVATPGWIERWGATLAIAATGLLLLGLWWYGRNRPYLPRDLRCAVGLDENQLLPRALGKGSLLSTMAGRSPWRPIRAENDLLLGWVRPQSEGLYDFRPLAGVTLGGSAGRSGPLQVHLPYQATTADGVRYWFRVEFE